MHGIVLTIVALVFTACGGGSPPSTPTTPTPSSSTPAPAPSSSTTNWLVTHSFVSVTGADNCWVQRQRAGLTGVVFSDLDMSVTRSGGAISIQSQWFSAYTGTHGGNQFTSRQAGALESNSPHDCGAGNIIAQQPGVSYLTGRFSPDDQTMSATESNVYPLNTGETLTYTWHWEARRR